MQLGLTITHGSSMIVATRMQQMKAQCLPALQVQSLIDQQQTPEWVANSETPIRLGGRIAFVLAWLLSLYTVLYVARAYKQFTLKVRLRSHLRRM